MGNDLCATRHILFNGSFETNKNKPICGKWVKVDQLATWLISINFLHRTNGLWGYLGLVLNLELFLRETEGKEGRLLANTWTLTFVPSHSCPRRKGNGHANKASTRLSGKTNTYMSLCQFHQTRQRTDAEWDSLSKRLRHRFVRAVLFVCLLVRLNA